MMHTAAAGFPTRRRCLRRSEERGGNGALVPVLSFIYIFWQLICQRVKGKYNCI
jgi:hypothetical protein